MEFQLKSVQSKWELDIQRIFKALYFQYFGDIEIFDHTFCFRIADIHKPAEHWFRTFKNIYFKFKSNRRICVLFERKYGIIYFKYIKMILLSPKKNHWISYDVDAISSISHLFGMLFDPIIKVWYFAKPSGTSSV